MSNANPQLHAEEVELQDRNTVLRVSAGGKPNVSVIQLGSPPG